MTIKQSPPGYKNVEGPLVESIQTQLNASAFNAGTVDGVWGSKTMSALTAWQTSKGMPASGIIDDATWTGLIQTPVPILSRRALQLTGAWEGTGYNGANGNFDGQGITWGVLGFTWGNGELQGILLDIQKQLPAVYNAAFGSLAAQMNSVLAEPLPQQMAFAQSISINNGNAIAPQWAAAFKALGDDPGVQDIENGRAANYWKAGQQYQARFGLASERGAALCFDIATQNTVTDGMIAEIKQRISAPGLAEADKLPIIAQVVANHANPKYYLDVLQRKMAIATGQGTVHGELYDVTCWGIG